MAKSNPPAAAKSTAPKESALSKLSQVSAAAMRLEEAAPPAAPEAGPAPVATTPVKADPGTVDKFTVSIWPSDTRKIKEVRRWLEDQLPDATTLDRSKVLRLALRALQTGPDLVELAREMIKEESATRKERYK